MDQFWLALAGILVVAVGVALYFSRRRGTGTEVIEAPRTAVATPIQPAAAHAPATAVAASPRPATGGNAAAIAAAGATAGDFLVTLGADEGLEVFADWLESEVIEALGAEAEEPVPTTRVAVAARKALPGILADGHATIDLPYLVVDTDGPRSFHRVVTRADLVFAVADGGSLDIRELMTWMAEDRRAVALGCWLMAEASEETGEDLEFVGKGLAALVGAARDAAKTFATSGAATVDLPALTIHDDRRTAAFRRTIDAAVMAEAMAMLREAEDDDN